MLKGEIAKLIKEYYIYKLKKCAVTSYSKYLKNFAKELADWNGDDNNKPRKFLQELGDTIRENEPTYFTGNMLRDIKIYEKYVDVLYSKGVNMKKVLKIIGRLLNLFGCDST